MSSRIIVFYSILLLPHTIAQCHGKGISKTTYASSADNSFESLNWMMFVLGMTPAQDSALANVQTCPSDNGDDWLITMNRGETVLQTTAIGSCTLYHSEVVTSQTNDDTMVAVMIPSTVGIGEDCKYITGNVFEPSDYAMGMTQSKTVNAHTPDTCCKSCIAEPNCMGASYIPYSPDSKKEIPGKKHSGPGPQPGECFGLHVTNVKGHDSSLGSVEYVEKMFTEKLAKMDKFDHFMDYNAAFFTSELDSYLSKLDDYGSLWFPSKWNIEINGLTLIGYSVFIQVAKSQLVVELLSFNSDRLESYSDFLHELEPRMTERRVSMFLSEDYHEDVVISSISRAVSDLKKLEELERFYIDGVGATKTLSIDNFESKTNNEDDDGGEKTSAFVSKRCFQWPGSSADVCFTAYFGDVKMTAGSFTCADFENLLHSSHNKWLKNFPSCANDKWIDNHYAVDIGDQFSDTESMQKGGFIDPLLEYVLEHDIVYTCGGGPMGKASVGAHYVIDPTGWGIQLDIDGDSMQMPLCDDGHDDGESASHPGPSSWCGRGVCFDTEKNTEVPEQESGKIDGEDDSIIIVQEEVDGDGTEVPSLATFPSFIALVLIAGLGAFAYGFTRGGGTPQALLGIGNENQQAYELVNRHAVEVVDEDDLEDDGFFEEDEEDDVGDI